MLTSASKGKSRIAATSLTFIRRLYCPVAMCDGFGTYTFTSECIGSILNIKTGHTRTSAALRVSGKTSLNGRQRASLLKRLRSANVAEQDALNLIMQPLSYLRNLEDCIHAVCDSLVLSFPELFDDSSSTSKWLVPKLIVKILRSGTRHSNTYEDIIVQWKSFKDYVWTKASRGRGHESLPYPLNNLFTSLARGCPGLARIIKNGIRDKFDATKIAHLTSSRQFPAGGKKATMKALETFKASVTETYVYNHQDIDDMRSTCRRIGEKCKSFLGGMLPFESSHISLSGAGDLDHPCSQGGRGAMIMESISRILTTVPVLTQDIRLPLNIVAKDIAGLPRWRTWARSEPLPAPDDAVFGEVNRHPLYVATSAEWAHWGLDHAVGYQIYYVALLEARNFGIFNPDNSITRDRLRFGEEGNIAIPARTAISCEPGGKARIVTTTKWWVVILEQAVGHFLRNVLAAHPSAKDGLTRADQAWLYLDALEKIEFTTEEYYFLSSDLKEATDHIPHVCGHAAIRGFAEGLGLQRNELLELALVLVGSKREFLLTYPDNSKETIVKSRGFMMGEPMTKSILTLVNLAAEEEAYNHAANAWRLCHLKRPKDVSDLDTDATLEPIPPEGWGGVPGRQADNPLYDCLGFTRDPALSRAYRVGGDDHIAYGPIPYLDRITTNHRRWGNKISETGHSVSKIVKYTEKILVQFPDTDFKVGARLINKSTANYDKSAFVDSIKVRLLSPVTRAIDALDEKNVAIGKARSLGRTLRWMNKEHFPRNWIISVRDRFTFRMKRYLPNAKGSIFKHLLLPQKLGGLDLFIDSSEMEEGWSVYNDASRKLISVALGGTIPYEVLRAASGMVTLGSTRGFSYSSLFNDMLSKYDLPETCEYLDLPVPTCHSVRELQTKYPPPPGMNFREQIKWFKGQGFLTEEQLCEPLTRAVLFNAILTRVGKEKKYNTTPWRTRFAIFWDRMEAIFGPEFSCPKKHKILSDRGFDIEPFAWKSEPPRGWGERIDRVTSFEELKLYDTGIRENPGWQKIDIHGRLVDRLLSLKELLEVGLPSLTLPNILEGTTVDDTSDLWTWSYPRSLAHLTLEGEESTPVFINLG